MMILLILSYFLFDYYNSLGGRNVSKQLRESLLEGGNRAEYLDRPGSQFGGEDPFQWAPS